MLVILDTNIFVSYLLAIPPGSAGVIQIVDAAFEGVFTLLLPEEQISEMRRAIVANPYLRTRIADEDLESFVDALIVAGHIVPALKSVPEAVTRDPKDDYLLATAVMANADVLGTGDRDLLELRDLLASPAIMTVAEFLQSIDLASSGRNVSS
ncbi:MAG: putative toxin-antitoxin system toxin component, PIN family [Thermomicrobiales bacterium]